MSTDIDYDKLWEAWKGGVNTLSQDVLAIINNPNLLSEEYLRNDVKILRKNILKARRNQRDTLKAISNIISRNTPQQDFIDIAKIVHDYELINSQEAEVQRNIFYPRPPILGIPFRPRPFSMRKRKSKQKSKRKNKGNSKRKSRKSKRKSRKSKRKSRKSKRKSR